MKNFDGSCSNTYQNPLRAQRVDGILSHEEFMMRKKKITKEFLENKNPLRAKRVEGIFSKGQTNEIFYFILAIIVMGLLLLFGVRYIMELGEKVEQIDLVRFKTDLEGYAKQIAPVYGKWRKLEQLAVPSGIDRICFVQLERFDVEELKTELLYKQQKGLCTKGHEDYDFLMCQAWQDDATRNVYTDPFDELAIGIFLGPLEVKGKDAEEEQYYLCIDTTDHYLRIKMTGYGDRVLIEELE